jgi:hypothetical protein
MSAFCGVQELKEETLQAWNSYIQTAESRMKQRLDGGVPFLWMEESPERNKAVCDGKLVVTPVTEHMPIKVPGGSIHDWIGGAFFRNKLTQRSASIARTALRTALKYGRSIILDLAMSANCRPTWAAGSVALI